MAAPGVVLKRPAGSSGPFKEHADLPTDLAGEGTPKKSGRKPQKHPKTTDQAADRKAAPLPRRGGSAAYQTSLGLFDLAVGGVFDEGGLFAAIIGRTGSRPSECRAVRCGRSWRKQTGNARRQ